MLLRNAKESCAVYLLTACIKRFREERVVEMPPEDIAVHSAKCYEEKYKGEVSS